MAKVSAKQRNKKRINLVNKFYKKRTALKTVIMNKDTEPTERLEAVLSLASLPRNGAKNRIRNRCEITGRPRSFYRKFKMSRIMLRKLGNEGMIPGLTKSSW